MPKARRGRYRKFSVGDRVEFYSSEHGGVWKWGTVSSINHPTMWGDRVRIYVGNGVHILRKDEECRMSTLPIDVVADSSPPIFRWKQRVSTIAASGYVIVDCEGALPAGVESAVADLVAAAKQLMKDNVLLQDQVKGMADRIAAQSELLGKRAETPVPAVGQMKRIK